MGCQERGRGRVKWVFFYLPNFKLEIEMKEMNLELHSGDCREGRERCQGDDN